MWELKVKITLTQTSNEDAEMWEEEVAAATLKVRIDHTETDEAGEYLPDDEVTADEVSKAVNEWQEMTGIYSTDDQLINYYYEPETAKQK